MLLSCSKGRSTWGLVSKTNTNNKIFAALLEGGLAVDQVWWLLVAGSVLWLSGFVLGGISAGDLVVVQCCLWRGQRGAAFAAHTCCPSRVLALTPVGA